MAGSGQRRRAGRTGHRPNLSILSLGLMWPPRERRMTMNKQERYPGEFEQLEQYEGRKFARLWKEARGALQIKHMSITEATGARLVMVVKRAMRSRGYAS